MENKGFLGYTIKMEIQVAKQQFLEYLEIELGRSNLTLKDYDYYLQQFFEFSEIKTIQEINLEIIRKFRLKLNRKAGKKIKGQPKTTMKRSTQNYYLIALRSFLKFLTKRGHPVLSPDVIELAKTAPQAVASH